MYIVWSVKHVKQNLPVQIKPKILKRDLWYMYNSDTIKNHILGFNQAHFLHNLLIGPFNVLRVFLATLSVLISQVINQTRRP